jgi:hypothetical protein
MKHLTFAPDTLVTFHGNSLSGLCETLTEAKKFVTDNNLAECDVIIDGFSFNIEPHSDIKEKMSEYAEGMTETDTPE